MRKIGIIGHFGGNEEFFDGQTVKTKILNDELLATGNFETYKVDTYYVRKNPVKVFFQTVKSMLTCDSVIVIVAQNGIKVFAPFLYFLNKITKTPVYHDALGADLVDFTRENKGMVKYVNSFGANWVELQNMCDQLAENGVNNAVLLPNIKRLKAVEGFNENSFGKKPFKFCTFSRVIREKGITDAINTIHKINKNFGEIVSKLDIYGPVADEYKEEFAELENNFGEAISYKGIVDFDKSVQTLKEYDALLFPTLYEHEGFPGTMIDAFYSAVPVIATNKSSNGDIVTDGITGIIYPNDKFNDLYDAIKWCIENGDEVIKMKKNALEESEKYDADTLMKLIIDAIS